jgi:hypothetical protein
MSRSVWRPRLVQPALDRVPVPLEEVVENVSPFVRTQRCIGTSRPNRDTQCPDSANAVANRPTGPRPQQDPVTDGDVVRAEQDLADDEAKISWRGPIVSFSMLAVRPSCS